MKRVFLSLLAVVGLWAGPGSVLAQAPVITQQPQSQKILPGAPAIFSVEPNSGAFTYQWERDGTNLSGATSATLSIPNAQYFNHAGAYRVRVSNGPAFTWSDAANLTFHGGSVNFNNSSPDVNAPVNNALTGERLASGAAFVAQLFAGPTTDQLLAVPGTANFIVPGFFIGGTREVPWVSPGSNAFFVVRVWNTNSGGTYAQAVANSGVTGTSFPFFTGSGSGFASPPVPPPPLLGLQSFSVSPPLSVSIAAHPTNRTVVAGVTTVFVVQATGSGTVLYQWRKNGVNISGATNSSYTIANPQPADAATYTVAVRDSAAIPLISNGAVLTVLGFIQAQINAAAPGAVVTVPAGTYLERIVVDRNITLRGAGAATTIIDAGAMGTALVINGSVTATVSNLTVRNAAGTGVRNAGTLRLQGCRIEKNVGAGERGAGLLNHGDAVVFNCTFATNGNFDYPTFGGGINNEAGATLSLTDSTVTENRAYGDGGIHNEGSLTVTTSAILRNHGTFGGGGIGSYQGTALLVNSTVSGNDTISDGGGFYNFASATLSSCTVVSNRAVNSGGGLWNQIGTTFIKNTILAGNVSGVSTPSDGFGALVSQGFNLLQRTNEMVITLAGTDLINLNPLLGPLQDNGGPTFTHALAVNSPAVDHGTCSSVTTDQRGTNRLISAGSSCDIGSYELITVAPTVFIIATSSSPANGGSTSGGGSHNANTSVTVTATPNSGFNFVNWTENGNAVSANPSYLSTATANRTLVANFTAAPGGGAETAFVTSVSPSGLRNNFSGSVGTKFTVAAAPITVTELGRYIVAGNSGSHLLRLVRASDKVEVASVTLDTAGAPGGQYGYARLNTPVTLSTNSAYYLVSTEVSSGDLWYDFERTRLTTTLVARVDAAVYTGPGLGWAEVGGLGQSYVPVDFRYSTTAVITYAITTSSTPVNGGTTTGGGSFASNATVTVTASANPGFGFAHWSQNGSVVSASPNYTFSAAANRALVATFTNAPVVSFTISAAPSPANGGTTTGGGTYNSGASVTLTAVANSGFAFTNWTENGNVVSSSASYVFSAAANRSLSANFNAVSSGGGGTAFVTGVTASGPRNNFSGGVGGKFTIGGSPVTVTELGRYVVPGNSGTHLLKIVRVSDKAELGSATVNTAGAAANQFAYGPLGSPVLLAANTSYYIVSTEVSGGDSWYDYDRSRITTTLVGRSDAAVYTGPGFGWVEVGGTGQSYVPVDFKYSTGPVVTYTIATASTPVNGGATSGGGTYNSGASVTLVATAATGFSFSSWLENGLVASTNPSYTFSAVTNRSLVATFTNVPIVTYTISTASAPGNGGTTTGTGTYNNNAAVTVTAAANPGFTFANWTENGSVVSTSASYVFNASANRTLVANFTVIPSGGVETALVTGVSVSGARNNFSGSVGGKFTIASAPVTVTELGRFVVPGNTGSHHLRLIRVGDKVEVGSATLNTAGATANQFAYVRLAGPVVLAANTSYYVVSTEVAGGDSWYDYDRTRLTTTPVAHSDSAVYTGPGFGWVEVGGAGQAYVPVDFKYSTGPVVTYAITTSSSPVSAGTTSGAGTYNSGASATVTATPVSGFGFAHWTDNGSVVSTTASYTFTVTGQRALVANFTNAPPMFNVAITSSPSNGGTTSGAGSYASNASVTVTAQANPGFGFARWTENGSTVSSGSSYLFTLAGPRSLVANFTNTPAGAEQAFVSSTPQFGQLRSEGGRAGMQFTVGGSPISVTALARLCAPGNSRAHAVRLIRASTGQDVPGALVNISMSGATPGQFVYASLPAPITLLANTTYFLVSDEDWYADAWYDAGTTVATTSAATCDGAGTFWYGWISQGGPNTCRGPVNFKYTSAGGSGGSAAGSMDGVPRLEISVRGDQVELILRGQAGGDYRLESSSDLIEWTVIGDVHLDEAAGLITRPRAEAREYFRATVK